MEHFIYFKDDMLHLNGAKVSKYASNIQIVLNYADNLYEGRVKNYNPIPLKGHSSLVVELFGKSEEEVYLLDKTIIQFQNKVKIEKDIVTNIVKDFVFHTGGYLK